ncbi:MAG: hypothetical protein EOP36_10080 [Rubrivivax sp.]|nr:MAG: hypothetical protein EOP36_10080 [Rubrivivax sp.]
MSRNWIYLVLGLMFSAGGLLLALASLSTLLSTRRFMADSVVTEAQVMQLDMQAARKGVVYSPVFRFTDGRGQPMDVRPALPLRNPGFKTGDVVRIRYVPHRFDTARPDDAQALWRPTWFCAALALLTSLAAWGAFYSWAENRRAAAVKR